MINLMLIVRSVFHMNICFIFLIYRHSYIFKGHNCHRSRPTTRDSKNRESFFRALWSDL